MGRAEVGVCTDAGSLSFLFLKRITADKSPIDPIKTHMHIFVHLILKQFLCYDCTI